MAKIVNAEGLVLGRMATVVAKHLLQGEKVEIVNAEKAIISGSREFLAEKLRTKIERGPKGNPRKGPKDSRMPDRIVRSAIRNMLPKYSKRGRRALHSLKVWIGVPKALEKEKAESIESARKENIKKSISVGELAVLCGAKWND
ncbi:MAG: 50S ribosomal protein L13 [Candidatus Diapherotrites archaeon]|uniref:Large ribosomal subunit protein uL13 n=1 Tax=Candidatus Iainarchaeum sp. TaxID=3101447 RepID=A0A7J4KVV8_9ARCH|nr:50S ribosomal protein L13 [Candidatus Diapherotrites archaeon]HIH21271.1 50S ribosomal protein L13 [Candidatus Diapherotrites archaeon]HIH33249.1 50S ribosomal protein L13 [Candidatus Diapherotrites archaeon]